MCARHHENIRRLLAGSEPRIGQKVEPDPSAPEDALDRLRLARSEGVGPVSYRRLLSRYASAAAALEALPALAQAGGRASLPAIPSRDDAAREWHAVSRLSGRMIFVDQPDDPAVAGDAGRRPTGDRRAGRPCLAVTRAVALVGGRNASANGQRMAEDLAAELAQSVVVVSGLAGGIDAAAHTGALRTGRTVAAIAGGLDIPLPARARRAQRRIAERDMSLKYDRTKNRRHWLSWSIPYFLLYSELFPRRLSG